MIKFCFKIKRGDGLLQAFSWKYTVCIHCLYTVCIRKPYLGYLCSCMRSVYETKAGYNVYALYPHRQISFTPGVHRQISRNFAALRAQANLKSKLIEHAFTPTYLAIYQLGLRGARGRPKSSNVKQLCVSIRH